MNCPVCDNVSLSISSREGVEIDFCPQCRGVWLDRGELDKIIERATPTGAGVPPEVSGSRRYDGDDDRDHGDREDRDYRDDRGRRRRRGSFLEDIFDFG